MQDTTIFGPGEKNVRSSEETTRAAPDESLAGPLPEGLRPAGNVRPVVGLVDHARPAELAAAETLRALVIACPLAVVCFDSAGSVTMCNPAAERIFGWTEQQLTATAANPAKRRFAEFEGLLVRGLRGESFTNLELRHHRQDGTSIDLSISAAPLQDGRGNGTGLVTIIADITEHKRTEEALQYERYLLNTLLDHLPDAIYFKDRQSRFIRCSRATVGGFGISDPSQVIGKTDFDFFTAEHARPAFDDEQRIIRTGEPIIAKVEKETWSAGRITWCLTSKLPLRNEAGEIIGTFGISKEITALKKAESDLQRAKETAEWASRARSEFLASMSHEIRTPMNGVIGMANLLLDTRLNQQQRDFAETIRTSAEALLTVVNDILDFSKIEAGKLAFETLNFDLQETLEGALEVLAEKADAKGLELGCSIAPATPRALRGDPMRLRQILTNLIGNAVKFTEHGEVMVQARELSQTPSHTRLRFEVKDTGIGISKEGQGRLFQPFSQADESSSRRFGGTGLGLAISKQLVELMHGQIGLESEPGRGTTFWFTVELETQPHPEPVRPGSAESLADLKVLIVDDNESNRQILDQQIRSWRMRGECAASGSEALELLSERARQGQGFDLALLDMQMPGLDGLSLAQFIKGDRELAGIKLIVLSTLGRHLNENELEQAGVAACLVKPIKQSRLFDCLATVVGSREPEKVAPVRPAAPSERRAQRLRILLAEDNSINQKVALGQLQRLGYRAEVAGHGLAVLEALQRQEYDLILMDCQMPELDGYETTQRIRAAEGQQGGGRRVRIVAMTAHAMKGDREKCLAAGMDDYISKPIRTEDLGRALEQCSRERTAETTESVEVEAGKPEEKAPLPEEAPVDKEWLLEAVGGLEAEARELAEFYLEQAREMLERLEAATREWTPSQIEQIAHKLAGASASCGVTLLLEPLRELEQGVRSGTLGQEQACRLYQEAQRRYEQVQQFLHACFAGTHKV
jgi:PAS domain S-box-containing protein